MKMNLRPGLRLVLAAIRLAAAAGFAREPGFAEFRPVQESLSLRAVHRKVGGRATAV
jgi:hypothetical protein